MTASKRKGTAFESAVRDRLAEQLGRVVHRLALNGTRDIGDIAIEGMDIAVECKAAKAIELGSWMTETLAEQKTRGTRWGVLVVKRRMKPVGDSYVVMTLDQWCALADAAYWRPTDGVVA